MKPTAQALQRAQKQARDLDVEIQKAEQALDKKVRALEKLILEYDANRRTLFSTESARRGVCWCSHCCKVVPDSSMAYIFIDEVKRVNGGYQNSCYDFKYSKVLHLACEACRKTMMEKNGWVGESSGATGQQERYNASHVELRGTDFFVSRCGKWESLEKPNDFSPPQFPDAVIAQLSQEWGLPPKLNMKKQRLVDPEWMASEIAA